MPDTKRLKSALATLFADNASGDISPQDLRDLLESLDVSRGAYYWSAFATTTMTLQGTAVAGGTNRLVIQGTTVSKTLNRFTHATPNKLTYTGIPAIKADFFAQFCGNIAGVSAQVLAFEFYHNGIYLPGSFCIQRWQASNNNDQITVFGEATLVTGDTLELMVANTTSAAKILTPAAGYVNVQEIPLG